MCLFCNIIDQSVPAELLIQTEDYVVIADKFPKADRHFLILPRIHLETLNQLTTAHTSLMGRIMTSIPRIAAQLSLPEGYRVIINVGEKGGQEIFHIHIHLLANNNQQRLPGF